MKKMKLSALFLALFLILSVLSACKNDEGEQGTEPTELQTEAEAPPSPPESTSEEISETVEETAEETRDPSRPVGHFYSINGNVEYIFNGDQVTRIINDFPLVFTYEIKDGKIYLTAGADDTAITLEHNFKWVGDDIKIDNSTFKKKD